MPIGAVVADANVLLSAVVGKSALRVLEEYSVALPVVFHAEPEYAERLPDALEQLEERDPEDAHALALAWMLRLPLWSNDRDFEGLAVERYTTARLLRALEG